ncbi:hypothetical protein BGZ63DRAFT_137537 [Mariannaea sp. PMI_226]|nr:hypothetical protein BGZ63DRAFT_137537 [Mariannaea sp. PMI_226]
METGTTPPELDEPSEVHSLVERTQHLQSILPSLITIFGETVSYDPSTYFSQWKRLLSESPAEPCRFEKRRT